MQHDHRLALMLGPVLALASWSAVSRGADTQGRAERATAEQNHNRAVSDTGRMRQKLQGAERDVSTAFRAMEQVMEKLRPEFEASPAWIEAQQELQRCKADRDAAVNPVLEKLRQQQNYKAAVEAKSTAQAEVEKLRVAGTKPNQFTAAATKSALASQEITRLELEALKADPLSQAALEKLGEAGKQCAELRSQFNESIKNRPEVVAARQELAGKAEQRDKVKTEVREAERKESEVKAALDVAIEREAQARRERENQRRGSGGRRARRVRVN